MTISTYVHEPVACAEVSTRLMELARRVARSECTVLIAGESGTGKEVLARYIHRHSLRARTPFVAVNCAAIPENMLEAILFGWERGAFTGAQAAHAGKFEQAQGGSLLLDEISEIPLALQAKLLRVLQEREVERLGARQTIGLDVRVIATTNRHLRADVASGRFREDLYYRLNVFPLTPVPLRARRDDVLPLAMRLLASHCKPGARIPALLPDAAQLLLTYEWPGNVRELENVMQRALVLCESDLIRAAHIVFEPAIAEIRPAAAIAAVAATAAGTDKVTSIGSHLAAAADMAPLEAGGARTRQPRARGRAARHQCTHPALQAGAAAGRRSRSVEREPAGRECSMSNMAIDQVLAQIRSMSAQAGAAIKPAAPAAAGAAGGVSAAQGPAFGELLKQGIESVNHSQQSASALADAWERGVSGVDLARVMIESQKASVSFRALTEVRNRLVTVYQDIMNMSI
jgi:flagellar hook-basal body complex protein FliE